MQAKSDILYPLNSPMHTGPFAEDAPAPYPKLSPGATIDTVLRSLRQLDDPEPSHGAAVLLRFCAPLSRAERWGGEGTDPWKEVLR